MKSDSENTAGKPWAVVAIALLAFAVLVLRRPDVLLTPQFWAEDGKVFYADAYHHGFGAFPWTYNGYLHPLPRTVAAIAQLLPLGRGPLFFNVIALGVQCLIPILLVSSRYAKLIPRIELRALLGLLYVLLPNCYEIHGTVTNAQWHLAPLGCLVLLATPPTTRAWRVFDTAVLVLVGLSGPFGIPLLVVAAAGWWRQRDRRWLRCAALLLGAGVVQLAFTLMNPSGRASVSPEPSVLLFAEVVGSQVFLATLLGMATLRDLGEGDLRLVVATLTTLWFGFLVVRAARRAPLELKLLLLFGGLLGGMTMASPTATWEQLANTGSAVRYWFSPALAFIGVLLWSVAAPGARSVRVLALLCWLSMAVGIVRDFRHPPIYDERFPEWAARFDDAAPGTRLEIPINPPGWRMVLTKHAPVPEAVEPGR